MTTASNEVNNARGQVCFVDYREQLRMALNPMIMTLNQGLDSLSDKTGPYHKISWGFKA